MSPTSSKKVLVTGAAGFIASNLIDDLLTQDIDVVGIDNLRTGKMEFLENALTNPKFVFVERDLFDDNEIQHCFNNVDTVFHLAANADVRFGPNRPRVDLEQNTIVTHNVLEAARKAGVKNFIFSSTGSVYGEAEMVPTPENAPFPIQTSLYGASKLACEGMVTAYAESFGMQVWIFRFVSILGPRYTHGHVVDFLKQLIVDPSKLTVLGNGHQKKSYLHVSDCVRAINMALKNTNEQVNIINLGVDGYCEVLDSIGWILDEMKLNPVITFGTENKGWIGDNPLIHLDITKMRSIGWEPKFSIEDSVRDTVKFLLTNKHLVANK